MKLFPTKLFQTRPESARRSSSDRLARTRYSADRGPQNRWGIPVCDWVGFGLGLVPLFILDSSLGKGGSDAVTLVTLLCTASQEKAQRGRHSSILHPLVTPQLQLGPQGCANFGCCSRPTPVIPIPQAEKHTSSLKKRGSIFCALFFLCGRVDNEMINYLLKYSDPFSFSNVLRQFDIHLI